MSQVLASVCSVARRKSMDRGWDSSPRHLGVAAAGAAVSLVCCVTAKIPARWRRSSSFATPEPEPQAVPLPSKPSPKPHLETESYVCRVGALGAGNDAAPPESGHTLTSAVARCTALGAVGFTFCGRCDDAKPLPVCYFKTTSEGDCPS